MSVESAVSSCGSLTSTTMAPRSLAKARWSADASGRSKIPVLAVPSQVGRTRIARTDSYKGGSMCTTSRQLTVPQDKSGPKAAAHQQESAASSTDSKGDSSSSISRSATVRYRCCIMPPSPHDTAIMDSRRADQAEPIDVPTIARVVESPPCHYIVDVCSRAACEGATPAQLQAAADSDGARPHSDPADAGGGGSARTVDGIPASSHDDMRARWGAEPLPPLSSVNAILWSLRGVCLTLHQSWWSYEVCIGRHARQFHAGVAQSLPPAADGNGQRVTPTSAESLVFSLGLYTPVNSWTREISEETSTSAAEVSPSGNSRQSDGGQHRGKLGLEQQLVRALSGPGQTSILPPALRAATATVETTVVVNHQDPIRSYVRQMYANGSACTLESDWLTGGSEEAHESFAGQLATGNYPAKLAFLSAQRAYLNAKAASIFVARETLRVAARMGDFAVRVLNAPLRRMLGLSGRHPASDASQPAIDTLSRWLSEAHQRAAESGASMEDLTSEGTPTSTHANKRRQASASPPSRVSPSGETAVEAAAGDGDEDEREVGDLSSFARHAAGSVRASSGFGIGRQPARRSAEVRFVCPMPSGSMSSPVSVAAAADKRGRAGDVSLHDSGAPLVAGAADDPDLPGKQGHSGGLASTAMLPFSDSKPVRRRTQLVSVDEVSLCHYQLTVEVPELCFHPAFARRHETDAKLGGAEAMASVAAPPGSPTKTDSPQAGIEAGRSTITTVPVMHGAHAARAVCKPLESYDHVDNTRASQATFGRAGCGDSCGPANSERGGPTGMNALPNGWHSPLSTLAMNARAMDA